MPAENSPDVASVVARVAAEIGQPLTLMRRFEVGSGAGAIAIHDGAGTPLVLKWWPNDSTEFERFTLRSERIPVLREVGWPIPLLLKHGTAGDFLFEIWAVAPGEPCVTSPAPPTVVARSGELVTSARGAALGSGQNWPIWLRRWISARLDGIETPAHSEVASLVRDCRSALTTTTIPPGRDLIHGDFTPANLLVEGDRITAVVDLDDCRDGDGTLDLIGMVWDLEGWRKASTAEVDALWDDILRRVDPEYGRVLLAYWIAGTLAWSTGTEEEESKCDLARRAWERFGRGS